MLFATFFGLWNLDIGRSLYPQMCLSQHISTLQAQFLEYYIALFHLAILTFKCDDHDCRIMLCICKTLYSCLAHLRRTINVRNSLVDAFATFIILSMNKIGYTSFNQCMYNYSPYGNYSTSSFNRVFWMGSSSLCSGSSCTHCCLDFDSNNAPLPLPSEIFSNLSE